METRPGWIISCSKMRKAKRKGKRTAARLMRMTFVAENAGERYLNYCRCYFYHHHHHHHHHMIKFVKFGDLLDFDPFNLTLRLFSLLNTDEYSQPQPPSALTLRQRINTQEPNKRRNIQNSHQHQTHRPRHHHHHHHAPTYTRNRYPGCDANSKKAI